MGTHRHLSLIAGLFHAASAAAAPVDTTAPGEPVERHPAADQSFPEGAQAPEQRG